MSKLNTYREAELLLESLLAEYPVGGKPAMIAKLEATVAELAEGSDAKDKLFAASGDLEELHGEVEALRTEIKHLTEQLEDSERAVRELRRSEEKANYVRDRLREWLE